MARTPFIKKQLLAGHGVGGCWINLFSPLATEILSAAGYDCLLLDLEHGPGSVMDAVAMMQAMGGSDCAPIVRIPENSQVWIKRILDSGVAGIMVPAVNNALEAAAVVSGCRYAPLGTRGMAAGIVRASGYGADVESYLANIGSELLVICQVETATAVAEAAEIAATDGVDMLFVGPYDLSAALGYLGQPDHPDVALAVRRIEDAAKAAGKLLGSIPTPRRSAEDLYRAGYNFVLADSDIGLLRQSGELAALNLRNAARQRQD